MSDAVAREQLSAPWFDEASLVARGGRVLRRLDDPGGGRIGTERELHLFDRVALTGPNGGDASVGTTYLVVTVGETLGAFGQLVIPVGAIRVVRAATDGATAEGIVAAQFGALAEGDLLASIPESGTPGAGVAARASSARAGAQSGERGGEGATVVAVVGGAVLPTLQHVVMLDAGTERGVRAGDPVTFYREDAVPGSAEGAGAIARGVVLRVTARGASALIVQQSQPALRVGSRARIGGTLP